MENPVFEVNVGNYTFLPKEEWKLPKSTTEIKSLYWAQTSDEPLTDESKRKKEEKKSWMFS